MDLDKYQALTGTTVSAGDTARYTAVINRVNALLEAALGYSLDPTKNLDITELGKVQFEGAYPYYPINTENLLPPDTATGTYRLFNYNEKDAFLKTDPFRNSYHAKLVQAQNDDEFVTYVDLFTTPKVSRKFGKYLEKQVGWFTWNWYGWLMSQLGHRNGLMLAVDADWIDYTNAPEDLNYLWADMVTYYASPEVSVLGNIKSESINGHSYTRGAAGGGKGWSKNGSSLRGGDLAPEQSEAGADVISRYAGPNGSLATGIPTT